MDAADVYSKWLNVGSVLMNENVLWLLLAFLWIMADVHLWKLFTFYFFYYKFLVFVFQLVLATCLFPYAL